ncbi:hypothetical protein FACS1894201_11690 [Bacteroidia bacterium]|nr:hypothetical protein FACS1894201_11690 [Bacteroidia bacterium]
MAGIHLAPELGINFGEKRRVFAGMDVMREFGSTKAIDFYDPIVYYEFYGKPFRFYMGAFPRKLVLDHYPRMFFQDSILNYRPLLNGLFWEIYSEKSNYFNVWLDWTARQTREHKEAFFMGWSGHYNFGMLYAQHFFYMFHFASLLDPIVYDALHDNGLSLTQVGIDLSTLTGFDKLELNIGWSIGLERSRDRIDEWHTPQGLLSELKVEYRGIGLFNTYYIGGSQQYYYNDHGNTLYWGDPIYRSKEYNRTDCYIVFFKNPTINLKLVFSLHFTEQTMYQEQALYATFDLNNLNNKKEDKPYRYLWDNWF